MVKMVHFVLHVLYNFLKRGLRWPRDPALTRREPRVPEREALWIASRPGSLQGVPIPAVGKARTSLGTADLLGLTVPIWASPSRPEVSEALRESLHNPNFQGTEGEAPLPENEDRWQEEEGRARGELRQAEILPSYAEEPATGVLPGCSSRAPSP